MLDDRAFDDLRDFLDRTVERVEESDRGRIAARKNALLLAKKNIFFNIKPGNSKLLDMGRDTF